jgi:hypothetical protein
MENKNNKRKGKIKRTIRQSQLISPWGIGQMINFPFQDESLMVAGLDAWENNYKNAQDGFEEFVIRERRLEKRLSVKHFRLPPDYREVGIGIQNPQLTIPFIRFPRWHYCYRCGSMEFLSIYQTEGQRCKGRDFSPDRTCKDTPKERRTILIPLRFVTLCQNGHIEDFPFKDWVHRKKPYTSDCVLRYLIRKSSTALGAINIICSCGERNTMSHSFDEDAIDKIGIKCSGQRPWLGEIKDEHEDKTKGCGERLQTVQKGGANVYYPDIRSSIFIPSGDEQENEELQNIIDEFWDKLSSRIIDGQRLDKTNFELLAQAKKVDVDKLYEAGLHKLETMSSTTTEEDSEEMYRKFEFDALQSQNNENKKDFLIVREDINKYNTPIRPYITNVSLVQKLRETRALIGFSRLLPENNKTLGEAKRELYVNNNIDWLPAIIVRGEGIFIEINRSMLDSWEKKNDVQERAAMLIKNYNEARKGYKLPERNLNSRFILLHTFAHLLIIQLSLQCGYGSSSLRERIYCDVDNPQIKMNGVLLYTASGDSEGSMGGLVKQGNPGRLEEIVKVALQETAWCSSDPICMDSSGQGPGSCNLAACHNCALLPETSCEEGNRLLDRGLLIGTISKPTIGFFQSK